MTATPTPTEAERERARELCAKVLRLAGYWIETSDATSADHISDDTADVIAQALASARSSSAAVVENEVGQRRELKLLREVMTAAERDIADRGKIQKRTALHDALAAYYRHLAQSRNSGAEKP